MSKPALNTATSVHRKLDFVAFVYEDDYRKIQELVQQYPDIETGGDLFGLWKDDRTVVIQLFIGPGKKSVRTTTSFHQDVEYLQRVGSLITTEGGLCNVGEWHSHHQIGMPEPSAADRRTVFNNMPSLGLERFVLFIATIENGKRSQGKTKKRWHDVKPEQVVLHPFLFRGPTYDVLRGKIQIIEGKNPHQIRNRAMREIEAGAEPPPFEEPFIEISAKTKSKSSDEESFASRAQQIKKSSDANEHWRTAQEKRSGPRTLKEQARAPKDIEEKVPEEPTSLFHEKKPAPEVRRETKPCSESGAVAQVQKHRDQESLHIGKKPQDDQQYGRRDDHHGASKSLDKRNPNQGTGSFNNENMSPNCSPASPTDRGTQSNASFPGLFPANQGPQFSNPSQQSYTAQGRDRGPSSPPLSPLYYHSAVTGRSAEHQRRNDSQREMQEMPPYNTLASSQRRGFPNDPQPVRTSRTTAGGPGDTTSYFKQQGVDVGKICGKGNF